MVMVKRGLDFKGNVYKYSIDKWLKENLDDVIKRVRVKSWDYLSITSGIPGSGKSNFAMNMARYCDENFTEKNIAFNADQFIKKTNELPEFSAVMLDESFQDLNAKVSNSRSFLKIVSHLQLIRQKRLFIFLNLPNFFDLSKGIAIFRSSHLFVVYSKEDGTRGRFCAFGRNKKRELYVKGSKFIDYDCVKANFFGKFVRQKFIDENVYEGLKRKHLMQQNKVLTKLNKDKIVRNNMVKFLFKTKKLKVPRIVEITKLSKKTIYNILNS